MSDLIDQLDNETSTMSSPLAMANTPSFKALVAMGDGAVPLLIEGLRTGKAVLPGMMALRKITGYVIPPSSSVGAMIDSWLAWYEDQ